MDSDILCNLEIVSDTAVMFKSPNRDNKSVNSYQAAFEIKNIKCTLVPTLAFEIIENEDIRDVLQHPEQFSGMIVTSGTTLEAIKKNLSHNPESLYKHLIEQWAMKPIFSVFDATLRQTEEFFNCKCQEGRSVSISDLPEVIRKIHLPERNQPYYYPHSNLVNHSFVEDMMKLGMKVMNQVVYKSLPNPELMQEWSRYVDSNKGLPQYLLFFSPSCVRFVFDTLHLQKYNKFDSFRIIPMGPTTAAELSKYNVQPFDIPEQAGVKFFYALMDRWYPDRPLL